MDAFTFIIGLTLAVAGVFLYRDYARFLRGAYVKQGKVVSIQQVFCTQLSSETTSNHQPFVKNGFYPIIEYPQDGGAIRFSAIDQNASGNFHVGDQVRLRIIKTRRKSNRTCKTVIALVSMLGLLGIGMLSSAIISSIHISVGQVFLASVVIAASLAILVLYIRDQDQHCIHDLIYTRSGLTQLYLAEPTAFKNWKSATNDPVQRSKIRSSQFFGATCMGSAMVVLVIAIQPFSQLIANLP